jgi:uncharacterized small protein (DUF1192 family)
VAKKMKGKIMFDEEGRKIDLGMQVGMSLEGLSVAELDDYIIALKGEITRVTQTRDTLKSHNATADALFK